MHAWEGVLRNDCKPVTKCGAGGGHLWSPWRMPNSGEASPDRGRAGAGPADGRAADPRFAGERGSSISPSGAVFPSSIRRGTIMIPNTCLAVFGTIQPGPLARYLRASTSGEEADGFMPRIIHSLQSSQSRCGQDKQRRTGRDLLEAHARRIYQSGA